MLVSAFRYSSTLSRERGAKLHPFSIRTIETHATMVALCDVMVFSLSALWIADFAPRPPHKVKNIFIERNRGSVGCMYVSMDRVMNEKP